MQQEKVTLYHQWFVRIAFTFWALFALFDYLTHETYFLKAMSASVHTAALLVLFIFHIGFLVLIRKSAPDKSGITVQQVSGWKLFLYFHFFVLVLFYSFGKVMPTYRDATIEFAFRGLFRFVLNEAGFLGLLAALFAAGNLALKVIPMPLKAVPRFLFSVTAGFFVVSILLFALASAKFLNVYGIAVVLLLVEGLGYKSVIDFFKTMFIEKVREIRLSWFSAVILFALPVSIALNLLAFMRPFPTGFDELSWYLNIPNLMTQNGGLISGNGAYYWSLVMSIGYVFGNNIAIVSWLSSVPGIVCIFLVYQIARYFLDQEFSVIAAVVFYLLPTIVWHSTIDAKVDLALTMIFLSTLLVLLELFSNRKSLGEEDAYLFLPKLNTTALLNTAIWVGLICGFCLGIKYTSFIFIPALLTGYVYLVSRQWMLTAALFFSVLSALFASNIYSITGISLDSSSKLMIIAALLAIAALAFAVSAFVKNRVGVLQSFKMTVPIALCAVLVFMPWVGKNYSETHSLHAAELLMGKDPMPSLIELVRKNLFRLREQGLAPLNQMHLFAATDVENPRLKQTETAKRNTASFEEKERYTGYKKGIVRYISIFRDTCTLANVPSFPNDAGLFVMIFLPLLFFRTGGKIQSVVVSAAGFGMLLLFVSISLLSANKGVPFSSADFMEKMNKLSTKAPEWVLGIYGLLLPIFAAIASLVKGGYDWLEGADFITSVLFILIFAAGLIWIQRDAIRSASGVVKLLVVMAGLSMLQWWLLGNGIVWYGLQSLVLGILLVLYFFQHVFKDIYLHKILLGSVGIIVLLSLLLRGTSYLPTYNEFARLNDVFIRFGAGDMDESSAFAENNKQLAVALAEINANPDAIVLRIGTFTNYFISRNNVRVIADNQLEAFDNLSSFAQSKERITKALRAAGVKYILYDLNTSMIDKTKERTLTNKIIRFYDYLSANPDIREIATDRVVAFPGSNQFTYFEGKQVPSKNTVFGKDVLDKGTTVLFKIN